MSDAVANISASAANTYFWEDARMVEQQDLEQGELFINLTATDDTADSFTYVK
jgi:hypothetical protein